MSRKSDQINTTLIKLEDDTDEFYSTAIPHLKSSSSMAYKGKIEVTSKGRRKIFDGVRWQILCRRPDCRKQTNKKSLCITHYKEEYETDLPTQFDIEYPNPHRMIHDGSIRSMHTARRLIFQNSKWQPLCKYDQLFPNKQSQISNHRRVSSSIIPYEKNKRLKINDNSMISSSVIEQFDIHSNEDSTSLSQTEDMNIASIGSKYSDRSSSKHRMKIDQSVQTDLTIPFCCILDQKGHTFFSRCSLNRKS